MMDPEAFWARHRQEAFHLAVLLTGSREAAEEALQESWVALLGSLDVYDPAKGSERALFFGILRNTIHRLGREGRRRPLSLDREVPALEEAEDPVSRREELEALLRALESMPPEAREAVSCRWILGWSDARMAEAWGVSPEAARQRAHRALLALRGALGTGKKTNPCHVPRPVDKDRLHGGSLPVPGEATGDP